MPMPKKKKTAQSEDMEYVEESLIEGDDIDGWMSALSDGGDVTIKLSRVEPEVFRGKNVSGHITNLDGPITEEQIKQRYGGGKYKIRGYIRDDKGQFKHVKGATFKIAGDPVIEEEYRPTNGKRESPPEDVALSKLAIQTMSEAAEKERERANRLEEEARKTGPNDKTLELLVNPLKEQIRQQADSMREERAAHREEMRELKRALEEARNQKPDTTAFEKILEMAQKNAEREREEAKEIKKELKETVNRKPDTSIHDRLIETALNTKAAELQQIRAQYESERRQLLDAHKAETDRIQDRCDRMLDSIKEDRKREIDSLTKNYEGRLQLLEMQKVGTENLLKERIQSLETELKSVRSELERVRDEKQKSPLDIVQELAALKMGLAELSDSDSGDDEEKSTWEKVLDRVEPIAGAALSRMNAGAGRPGPNGLTPEQMAMVQAQQQQQAAIEQGGQQPPPSLPPTPEQLEQAAELDKFIQFVEAAVSNGTDPAIFARSARNMAPADLLRELTQAGPDQIIEALKLRYPDSSIVSAKGREFIKKVIGELEKGE